MAAKGRLEGAHVLVPDEREAATLYNKGAFGTPQSGGALLLELDEALYLVENQRLSVAGHDAGTLLRHASGLEHAFEIRYIVYRDLRGRTFAVKRAGAKESAAGAGADYHVYDRGAMPGRSASKFLVRCFSERDTLRFAEAAAEAERARKFAKSLLLALVDEEGDLTYYDTKLVELQAAIPALPGGRADAFLLEDRVVVTDRDGARALREGAYFGHDVGFGLQLALPEAVYLQAAGRLAVRDAKDARAVAPDELVERARRLEPEFDLRQALYSHLRACGIVVKTGFKFGTHFRAYTGSPDEEHSPYLVHALRPEREVPWPEVAGFVRLAHGVRKRLFFATPREGGFDLLELARRKP